MKNPIALKSASFLLIVTALMFFISSMELCASSFPEGDTTQWMPVFYGHEIQIDNMPELSDETEYHSTGMIYSLTKPLFPNMGKQGPEWNTFEIILDGPRTIVYLNGVKVTDYTDGDPVPPRTWDFEPFHGPRPDYGYMGLQNHGEEDVVFFKEVAVKPLR